MPQGARASRVGRYSRSVEIWPSGGVSEALLRPCGCGMAGKPEYAMCMPELLAFICQGRYTAMAGSGM